jgi:hypothetical protein
MSDQPLGELSRREILQKCIAMCGVMIVSQGSPTAMAAAFEEREREVRKPTPSNDLGPFYKRRARIPGA